MAKYCSKCGKEVGENEVYCGNCGASLSSDANNQANNDINNNNINSGVKDYTIAGFVCSIVGFLCCTYVAIPGLILSIISLNNINSGKIVNGKKGFAIAGIVIGALGICFMIYNIINPNPAVSEMVNEWLS